MATSVTEVGAGDLVKIGGKWKEIASNSASGEKTAPFSWTVVTTDGESYGPYDIDAYAKSTGRS